MSERRCRVLLFDWDEDALLALQHVLEEAGFDTTITWDQVEARELIKNERFDLLLVGDHPPELTAETILRDFNFNLDCSPCLLLRANPLLFEDFRRLGVSGVVPKRDPFTVLDEVQRHCRGKRSDVTPTPTTAAAENSRAASVALKADRQAA